MNAPQSQIQKQRTAVRRQLNDTFERPTTRSALKIPSRPRIGSAPSMENQMPSTRHEGGARIPTIEEAYAVQEKQFYAQRKAEFDAILEKASLQEQREIEQAKEVIKQEVKRLAKMNVQMNEKLLTLQQMTLDQSEKKGVYYVRFMELMTELVRTLAAQVSESNTWLEAMISKKKKRGSLFAARSKNQGTQYSMSQELSIARSTN